ncbi:MAG TPA: hypothetical protein ENO01_02610 [Candidatus Marinimicrobia bacterium]|nr:hypothetical protein [Candidatus Neomarinimicrobiota bacterium]
MEGKERFYGENKYSCQSDGSWKTEKQKKAEKDQDADGGNSNQPANTGTATNPTTPNTEQISEEIQNQINGNTGVTANNQDIPEFTYKVNVGGTDVGVQVRKLGGKWQNETEGEWIDASENDAKLFDKYYRKEILKEKSFLQKLIDPVGNLAGGIAKGAIIFIAIITAVYVTVTVMCTLYYLMGGKCSKLCNKITLGEKIAGGCKEETSGEDFDIWDTAKEGMTLGLKICGFAVLAEQLIRIISDPEKHKTWTGVANALEIPGKICGAILRRFKMVFAFFDFMVNMMMFQQCINNVQQQIESAQPSGGPGSNIQAGMQSMNMMQSLFGCTSHLKAAAQNVDIIVDELEELKYDAQDAFSGGGTGSGGAMLTVRAKNGIKLCGDSWDPRNFGATITGNNIKKKYVAQYRICVTANGNGKDQSLCSQYENTDIAYSDRDNTVLRGTQTIANIIADKLYMLLPADFKDLGTSNINKDALDGRWIHFYVYNERGTGEIEAGKLQYYKDCGTGEQQPSSGLTSTFAVNSISTAVVEDTTPGYIDIMVLQGKTINQLIVQSTDCNKASLEMTVEQGNGKIDANDNKITFNGLLQGGQQVKIKMQAHGVKKDKTCNIEIRDTSGQTSFIIKQVTLKSKTAEVTTPAEEPPQTNEPPESTETLDEPVPEVTGSCNPESPNNGCYVSGLCKSFDDWPTDAICCVPRALVAKASGTCESIKGAKCQTVTESYTNKVTPCNTNNSEAKKTTPATGTVVVSNVGGQKKFAEALVTSTKEIGWVEITPRGGNVKYQIQASVHGAGSAEAFDDSTQISGTKILTSAKKISVRLTTDAIPGRVDVRIYKVENTGTLTLLNTVTFKNDGSAPTQN